MSSSNWTTPALEEVKMDAEIGSYQADERGTESMSARFGVRRRRTWPVAAAWSLRRR